MVSLLLDAPDRRTPLEVARWFGAMQAQDVASGHWSLGVRCEGAAETDVLDAFERGDLVRTWPMRGTIHVVPATDVRWLLDLTGVRTLTTSVRRREQLGLSLAEMQTIEPRINREVFKALTVENSVARRRVLGGTSPANVAREAKRWLKILKGKA